MKLTQEVIDKIQEAMYHTKMNGDVNWMDGDEIDVCLAGAYAGDKFIIYMFLCPIQCPKINVLTIIK